MFYILRRPKLGLNSTKAIKEHSQHEITIIRNDNIPEFKDNDIVLRWGCTSDINFYYCKVLNKKENIHLVNNKSDFRHTLNIQAPDIIPKTWFNYLNPNITYPCIVRPQNHAQGKNIYLCNNYEELFNLFATKTNNWFNYYISEYIPKIAEYRVCFIQGLVAWVANKIPSDPNAIAWNVAQGGKFENVRWKDWPINIIKTAYKAYIISGLYLGGVDIMVDKEGRSYVLEINSAPSHTSPYRQACTTKCIDYGITHNMFHHLQPNNELQKYGKWLHPALKNT